MLGDDDLPPVDEDLVQAAEQQLAEKARQKESRVQTGADVQIDVEASGDGLTPEQVAALSPAEREARWEFTHDELQAATKVVSRLFTNPHLYVGDPELAASRLYTMISRDRKAKRENKATFKKVMNEERSRRQRQQREEDLETIRKTEMKRERDAALNMLMLPPAEDDAPLLLTEGEPTPAAAGEAESKAEEAERLAMHRRQKCHTCKNPYTELHRYYYSLCQACGDLNFAKRHQRRDLTGKVVLLTGCRIKIGYAMAVSLLRAGAIVLGTTRFVHDGLNRFSHETDYDSWKDRLHLFAVDFRDLWMTTQFCGFVSRNWPKLFAIVNNAAQTIARTPEYTASLRYHEANADAAVREELTQNAKTVEWMSFFLTHSSVSVGQPMALECAPLDPASAMPVPGADGSATVPALTQTPVATAAPGVAAHVRSDAVATAAPSAASGPVAAMGGFPKPRYDRYDTAAEAADLREKNTWTTELGDVAGGEAAEVMAINSLAPLILNSKLKPCLVVRSPEEQAANEGRFIINVSAMEGQFYRFKQTAHPHTNMAKAALNMMTRTSAADYAKDGIYMNSVDTGWITDESPLSKKARRAAADQLCPLDEVDAAARCLDPIYTDSKEFGKFLKDYHEIPW